MVLKYFSSKFKKFTNISKAIKYLFIIKNMQTKLFTILLIILQSNKNRISNIPDIF